MKGRRTIAAVLALVLALALTGCAQGGSVPDGPPTVRGVISDVRQTGDQYAILVVWAEGVGEMGEVDAAHLTVNDETTISSSVDVAGISADQELAASDLKPGLIVEAWVTGGVAESYPIQARASQVEVIGEWEGEIPTPLGLMPETEPQPEEPEGRKGEPGTLETTPE